LFYRRLRRCERASNNGLDPLEIILPSLKEVLADFSFSPVPSLDGGKARRWRQCQPSGLAGDTPSTS
jgi:hypothetical protein